MKRKAVNEAAIKQRQDIAAQRGLYYAALAEGMTREEASAFANSGGTTRPASGDDIPEDWQSWPYLPRFKGGPSLRSLAAALSGHPINSKDDAIAAIEAELERRAEG